MTTPSEDEIEVEALLQKHLDETLAMTDEEVLADLQADGVDLAEVKARASDWRAQIERSKQQSKASRRRPVVVFLASFGIAAALAAIAAVEIVATNNPHPQPDGGSIVPEPLDRGAQLRALALAECGKSHWKECIEGLDQAQGIDSKSDDLPEVKDARAKAAAALADDYDAYAPGPHPRKTPPRP